MIWTSAKLIWTFMVWLFVSLMIATDYWSGFSTFMLASRINIGSIGLNLFSMFTTLTFFMISLKASTATDKILIMTKKTVILGAVFYALLMLGILTAIDFFLIWALETEPVLIPMFFKLLEGGI